MPPCATTEGAGAIYSDADGRYGSLLKVCDLQIHQADVLFSYSSKNTWSLGRCIIKWKSSIVKEIQAYLTNGRMLFSGCSASRSMHSSKVVPAELGTTDRAGEVPEVNRSKLLLAKFTLHIHSGSRTFYGEKAILFFNLLK
jgi:hypothetical protein